MGKLCACGCGEEIVILKRYSEPKGKIPNYKRWHYKPKGAPKGEKHPRWKGGKENTKKYMSIWQKNNKDKCAIISKKYADNNKDKVKITSARKTARSWFSRNTGLNNEDCPLEIIELRLNLNRTKALIKKEKQNAKTNS